MYTLLIDTHMSNVVIVLFKDGKVVNKINEFSNQSHSVITMNSIKAILDNSGINVNDVGSIIVVNGPGSFTGVRIGVTIAKTISYCLNLPIRVISSLEVILSNVYGNGAKTVALNDKNGYFVASFDENNQLLEDYQYLNNKDYALYKDTKVVIDNITDIDYEKVYAFALMKQTINPHLVNPLYVKKIEVQK